MEPPLSEMEGRARDDNQQTGDTVQLMIAACVSCRQAKIKCEKQQPCSRCVRLSLECVAQERSRGRPKAVDGGGSSAAFGDPSNAQAPMTHGAESDDDSQGSQSKRPRWNPMALRPESSQSQPGDPIVRNASTSSQLSTHAYPSASPMDAEYHCAPPVPQVDSRRVPGSQGVFDLGQFMAEVDAPGNNAPTSHDLGSNCPSPAKPPQPPSGPVASGPSPGESRAAQLRQFWCNPFVKAASERAVVVIIVTALAALHRERRVDLQRLLAGVRAQALAVLRFQNPMMLSLLELTASVVGINWRDSVDEQEAVEALMAGRVVAQRPTMQKAIDEIKSIVEPWRDANAMLSYFVTIKGETRLCCDDSFVKSYMRDHEEVTEIYVEQTCPLLVWGRMLSPEDQQCFFNSLVQAFYGLGQSAGEACLVSKCVSNDGSERVSLVRFRVLFSTLGLACALSVTPLPLNKYMTEPQQSAPQWSSAVPAPSAPRGSGAATSGPSSANFARFGAGTATHRGEEKVSPLLNPNGYTPLQRPQQPQPQLLPHPHAQKAARLAPGVPRGPPLVGEDAELRAGAAAREGNLDGSPLLPPPPAPDLHHAWAGAAQGADDYSLCEGDLHSMLMESLL